MGALANPFGFVLFSVLLRTTIFMSRDGELRTSPLCSEDGNLHGEAELIKVCVNASATEDICYFMKKASYLLAMQEENGQLTSIKMRDGEVFDPQSTEHCTLFRVKSHSSQAPQNRITITGCFDRKQPWRLAMDGQRFKPPHCTDARCDCTRTPSPYYQAATEGHTLTTRHYSFYFLDDLSINQTFCPHERYDNMRKRCPGVLRTSYPLHWNKCPKSKAL